ncbi:hypothetical protein [uncultured Tenacibaculum sp.]|uniref:hypothetical protein n=1 Tax=uncultured Tenacibaculum sp. TaxID=174713 RepID=UPI002632E0E6|nr:hypothetical protein [uncultured Tenacibaculum sp.]
MKKQISKLGKALSKSEQKEISGGINHPETRFMCHFCLGEWVVWNNIGHCFLRFDSPCYNDN